MRTTKLKKLNACEDAIKYVRNQKSPEEAWNNCSRGDWMLWLARRLDVDNRLLTLAKATCANQVRSLMTDQRSLDALDACFRYANGELTREELNTFTSAASDAADAADYADYAAYYAAAAAYAASADAAAAAADDAASATAARKESLKKSADICREILTDVVLQKYKKLRYAKNK